MLNTDNGVLVMLIARLLDEPAAIDCEARALRAGGGLERHTPGEPLRGGPRTDQYLSTYLPCFVQRITSSLLLHRLQRTPLLPWLRFLFPREGWQRSFESPAPKEGQHHALTSFQPSTDFLGHGWKAMGRKMVIYDHAHDLAAGLSADLDPTTTPGHEQQVQNRATCAPLRTNASGCATLARDAEAELAIEMCWWLHRTHAAAACRACAERAPGGRVMLRTGRIGFVDGKQTLLSSMLNLSERDARGVFGSGCLRRRPAVGSP